MPRVEAGGKRKPKDQAGPGASTRKGNGISKDKSTGGSDNLSASGSISEEGTFQSAVQYYNSSQFNARDAASQLNSYWTFAIDQLNDPDSPDRGVEHKDSDPPKAWGTAGPRFDYSFISELHKAYTTRFGATPEQQTLPSSFTPPPTSTPENANPPTTISPIANISIASALPPKQKPTNAWAAGPPPS